MPSNEIPSSSRFVARDVRLAHDSLSSRSHYAPRTTHRAFTLIELLVVIAIIATLAAILFPVFAQAREKARSAACLSNQKQIATGILMYSQDYDEMLLMGLWGTSASGTLCSWPAMIQPYIKNIQVFKCPSAPASTGVNPGTIANANGCGIGNGFATSYLYNYYLGGNNNPNGGVMTASVAQLIKPSETVMLTDGGSLANVAGQRPDVWPVKVIAGAVANYPTTANRFPYLLIHAGSTLMTTTSDHAAPRAWHQGMCNVVWADSHVKATKIERFYNLRGSGVTAPAGAASPSLDWSPCLDPNFGCQ